MIGIGLVCPATVVAEPGAHSNARAMPTNARKRWLEEKNPEISMAGLDEHALYSPGEAAKEASSMGKASRHDQITAWTSAAAIHHLIKNLDIYGVNVGLPGRQGAGADHKGRPSQGNCKIAV